MLFEDSAYALLADVLARNCTCGCPADLRDWCPTCKLALSGATMRRLIEARHKVAVLRAQEGLVPDPLHP